MDKYYYCKEYDKYVCIKSGVFYCIENNNLVRNDFYDKILIGSIIADEITEEEFNKKLFKGI